MLRLLGTAACAAAFALAGSGGDDPAGSRPFRLDLTVVDTAGRPLAGYEARLHVPIPGVPGFPAKPATRIRFDVASACSARVVAYDLDGAPAAVLYDRAADAGAYEVAFVRLDGGEPLLGTRVYRVELALFRDGAPAFRDTLLATLYASIDYQQRPILGVSDAAGRISFADAREFPSLYDLGPQPLVDEDAEVRGEFVFGDDAIVTLTEPGTGLRLDRELTIAPGPNAATLVWDPGLARAVKAEAAGPRTPAAAQDVPVLPLGDRLVQNSPNPFN
jgi:hypothetical protein